MYTFFVNYVMNISLSWESRSHDSRQKVIGLRFMGMRLPYQGDIYDVIGNFSF